MDIGHLSLDYNRHMGYQLQEELNGLGAVFNHTGHMKIAEMKYFLIGMIKGVKISKSVLRLPTKPGDVTFL
jgi:hypothetical protein